jgi:tetratricopeptide (TPR) repeat protein
MRTRWMEFPPALLALIVVALLPSNALLRAEERDSQERRRALNLNDLTGMDPLRGKVRSLLQDKPAAKKMIAEAVRMAQAKPQPFHYNATHVLGSVALELKNYQAAETFYRLYLEQAKQLRSTQGILTGYGGVIASVYAAKRYAEAEKLCEEVQKNELLADTLRNLEFEKDKDAEAERKSINRLLLNVLEEEIMAVAFQGDVDRAIGLIKRFFKAQADAWPGLDLKARVYSATGKYAEALKTYQEEMERIKEDKDLEKDTKEGVLDDVRYSLSGVYVELGDIDKAANLLKELMQKEPDNPKYNNDLGYIWADHDRNLAEAEKLIRKAIEVDCKQRQKRDPNKVKERGAYLDSLGWVLYKQKKYAEAKRYLQQALQRSAEEDEGESIEIFDHYGDVLMKLGEKTQAVAAWKKGVEAAGDSKREQKRKQEVQKKIKANE